ATPRSTCGTAPAPSRCTAIALTRSRSRQIRLGRPRSRSRSRGRSSSPATSPATRPTGWSACSSCAPDAIAPAAILTLASRLARGRETVVATRITTRGGGGSLGIGLGVVFVVALLFIVFAIFGSFPQVGVGEVGVVQHLGPIDPAPADVLDPGIHTDLPFRDDVVI